MIQIIDYGMGNLRSVQKAFEKLNIPATIIRTPAELHQTKTNDTGENNTNKLVLPGVGAFRDAIHELKTNDWVSPIADHIAAEKPFLGICLGLQLLFDVSYEDGEWEGLGIIPGEVVRFENQPGLKIPHMGWNELEISDQQIADQPQRFRGIPNRSHVYFVHSYHVVPRDESVIAARCQHGIEFTAAIAQGNLFATQFHPEKSQQIGLKLLENFATTPAPQ